jgi:hypothetical protein
VESKLGSLGNRFGDFAMLEPQNNRKIRTQGNMPNHMSVALPGC